MKEYLLFVDTETTGLPTNWTKPYAAERHWPYIAQLAWAVYTRDGQQVKAENHYLHVPKGSMRPSAVAIHGLTPSYLEQHGEEGEVVLKRFYDDLRTYQPLVVGHYMRLDFHMLGAGFHRVGLPNPLSELPTHCTMQSSRALAQQIQRRYLRLGELYETLFQTPMERQHDAWVDALATAKCFFELQRHGDITEQTIEAQQYALTVPAAAVVPKRRPLVWFLILAAVGALLLLLTWLYG